MHSFGLRRGSFPPLAQIVLSKCSKFTNFKRNPLIFAYNINNLLSEQNIGKIRINLQKNLLSLQKCELIIISNSSLKHIFKFNLFVQIKSIDQININIFKSKENEPGDNINNQKGHLGGPKLFD